MTRFNKKSTPTVGPRSAIQTTDERVRGFEGRLGYKRTAKSELFLLAVSFMGGDDNFYEKDTLRYNRLVHLVNGPSVYGDMEWLYSFISWLRNEAGMRTVPMVIAVEVVLARLLNDLTEPEDIEGAGLAPVGNRDLISVAMGRGDEPAETMSYWIAKHGGQMPWPIRNGIADGAVRLYNEFSVLRYGFRTNAMVNARDVLRMTHPKAKDPLQNTLFDWIVGKGPATSHGLPMIYARQRLNSLPREERSLRNSFQLALLRDSGFTWENLSEWNPKGMDAEAWEVMIPRLGSLAALRNLRNFDRAGISISSVSNVKGKITKPGTRFMPFQVYNAYRNLDSLTWGESLEIALRNSLTNVPKFKSRNGKKSLVLVDMSGSMFMTRVSKDSEVTYSDVASLFGAALKQVNGDAVDLYQFGSQFPGDRYVTTSGRRYSDFRESERWTGVSKRIDIRQGSSILLSMNKFHEMGGTKLHEAVAETYGNGSEYDRVIIITDEQAYDRPRYDDLPVKEGTNVYIWNLGGYEAGVTSVGKYHRHSFGGLTDNAFRQINLIESGKTGHWPWEDGNGNDSAHPSSPHVRTR